MPSNPMYYISPFIEVLNKIRSSPPNKVERVMYEYSNNLLSVNPFKRMLIDLGCCLGLLFVCGSTQTFDVYYRYMSPYLGYVLTSIICANAFIVYYLIPQLSKHHP
ncbi:hypothetical protein AKO1_006730, partial [Acrasis kona]